MTVQIRSLDPQSAELMSINLSSSINTLLPGRDPLPPLICFSRRTPGYNRVRQFQEKKPKQTKHKGSIHAYLAMGFSTVIWSPPMTGARGVCPLLPTTLLRTLRIPKPLYWEMTVEHCRAEGRKSASFLASINVTCLFSPAWSSHPKT